MRAGKGCKGGGRAGKSIGEVGVGAGEGKEGRGRAAQAAQAGGGAGEGVSLRIPCRGFTAVYSYM